MQFSPDMVDAILSGRKTRTTRPVTGVECTYRVGRDYAVCPGRGKRQVARIRVTNVQKFSDLFAVGSMLGSDEHAHAEGFASWKGFEVKWDTIYPFGTARNIGPVWTIDFELVKESGSGG